MATPNLNKKELRALLKAKKKEIKENLRAARAEFKKNKNREGTSVVGKILLTILLCGLAFGAFIGVAALSCNLSCSGNESAAAIVLLLGLGGIIAGLFFGIRAIYRKKGKGMSP